MAKRMQTSRSALDRLLDSANPSVTLQTMDRAARAWVRNFNLASRGGPPRRREERHVDAGEARAELNDRICEIFGGKTFEASSLQ